MRYYPELAPYVAVPFAAGVAVAYVVAGFVGNKLMEGRTAFDLTALKVVYNVTQIVVCSCTFMGLLPFFTVRAARCDHPCASFLF